MAGPRDKRRQLDDEMSRFEAEILSGPRHDIPMEMRPIIGVNTFHQVKEQLKQANADFQGKSVEGFGPCIPPDYIQNSGIGSTEQFSRQPGADGSFGPPSGNNRVSGPFPPPPPIGFSGGNFPPQSPMNHPPAPPGFIPPQLDRPNIHQGPMINNPRNMFSPGRPRPPSYLHPPPPPPPGFSPLGGPRMLMNDEQTMLLNTPPVISKPATVFSSAPKLYAALQKSEAPAKAKAPEAFKPPTEATKKKHKAEKKVGKPKKKLADKSQAQEMAEKVKQSTTTTRQQMMQLQPFSEEKKKERKPKRQLRYAGGQVWEDCSLNEWDTDDFRMFVGDLGNDVTDDLLHRQFCHYASFVKAKVVRDKRTNKSKGFGFVSFKEPQDYIRAMKEMNGKYLGSRPIKLRKSMWKERNLDVVHKKVKEKQLLGLK